MIPAGHVRTVLGDVGAEALGRTDYHEHAFQVSPLLPGEDLDDERASEDEVGRLRDSGFEAVVDATPVGLGRRPEALARIAASTGVTVVATTGAHRSEHYPDDHWIRGLDEDALAALFVADVVDGQPVDDDAPGRPRAVGPQDHPVRAGLLKAGIGYWRIDAFEARVLGAVGAAHRRTSAPVMVHLEHGSATHEVLDALERHGVRPDRVVLAHVDRNPDPVLWCELAARGAYLGCDGAARTREWPESTLVEVMRAAAEAGAGERLLLGGDVARRSRYAAYGGMPGLAYLGERFVPRLTAGLGADVVGRILRDNPRRLLAAPDHPDEPGDQR